MSMETNKIFGAILLALLIGTLSGFIAEVLVHPKALKQPSYVIAVPESAPKAEAAAAGSGGPAAIGPLLAKADAAAGQTAAKACAACHTFNKGEAGKVGPNLYGIIGGPKAHAQGFAYSDAIAKKGGNWDYEELNHFLFDPKGYAPGTKMTFAGVKKDQERANIVAYLRSLSDTPPPLPQ
ncbi:cytochrome c family protein [Azospirillum sp. TSO22-1]|uniref:c-type cytochrome n=1 Tax=Azospirillum sp. TSO22-1 TaxID=716789 RepID=UPI000D615924|nr:cytochrome c family protein [Azospirillum sp. TSO22-1]PWC37049.1 cytochrome C [Azospirillum sp. TSO22-1]